MLTSKQRAYLRSLSNSLGAIFQVGKGGIGQELCTSLDNALAARELIKVHVLDNCPYSAKEAAALIAEAIGADVVSVVGTKVVFYKESPDKKQIVLP